MLYPSIIYIIGGILTGSPIWPLMCIAHPGIVEAIAVGLFIWSFWW